MSDLISRQAAIELIHSLYPSAPIMPMNRKRWKKKYKPYIEAEKALEMLPSAQTERKRGKWLVDEDGNMECPFCGNTCGFGNYCNECGADMRGIDNG